jgi:hypothetical protein
LEFGCLSSHKQPQEIADQSFLLTVVQTIGENFRPHLKEKNRPCTRRQLVVEKDS